MTVVLDGASLTLEDVVRTFEGNEPVELAGVARARMASARSIVEEVLESRQPAYGLTTGVAERKRFPLGAGDAAPFNRLLVRSHRVAQGPAARPSLARATMLCLVNSLAKGIAGVQPELADMVVTALDDGVVPVMHTLGSVRQADLGPMADLAEGLLQHSGLPPEPMVAAVRRGELAATLAAWLSRPKRSCRPGRQVKLARGSKPRSAGVCAPSMNPLLFPRTSPT